MKRRILAEQQVIGVLKPHQGAQSAADLCRKHGISDGTSCKWCSKFGNIFGGQSVRGGLSFSPCEDGPISKVLEFINAEQHDNGEALEAEPETTRLEVLYDQGWNSGPDLNP